MTNNKTNKKIIIYTLIVYIFYLGYHNLKKIIDKISKAGLKPFDQIIKDIFNPNFWFAWLTGNLEVYNPKKLGTVSTGQITLLETEPTGYANIAKYFKISEYMANYKLPELFKGNLDLLYYNLDIIRQKWGSSIKIVTGYDATPYTDSENTTCYQRCLCVRIFPTLGNTILLNQLILSLRENKQIHNCTIIHEPNQYIYLSFTKA